MPSADCRGLTVFGSVLKLKVGHLCKELAGKVEPVDLWPECQRSSVYCQFGPFERNFVFRLDMHGESENLRRDIPEIGAPSDRPVAYEIDRCGIGGSP